MPLCIEMNLVANVAMSGLLIVGLAALVAGMAGGAISSCFVWWALQGRGLLNGLAGCFWVLVLAVSVALIWIGGSWLWALS